MIVTGDEQWMALKWSKPKLVWINYILNWRRCTSKQLTIKNRCWAGYIIKKFFLANTFNDMHCLLWQITCLIALQNIFECLQVTTFKKESQVILASKAHVVLMSFQTNQQLSIRKTRNVSNFFPNYLSIGFILMVDEWSMSADLAWLALISSASGYCYDFRFGHKINISRWLDVAEVFWLSLEETPVQIQAIRHVLYWSF